jgi:hypothetical protein
MKLSLSITTLVLLTGCAQYGAWADRNDPCQGQYASPERRAELGRPVDYKNPDWCYSGSGYKPRVKVYDAQNKVVGYIR